MPLILRLAHLPRENLSFGFSPGIETLHSLHVLVNAKHHPLHIPWVLRARRQISPALKSEIEAFAFLFGERMAIFWDIRDSAQLQSFADELAAFRGRPGREIAGGVLAVNGKEAASPEVKRLLREDPDGFRDRLADMLGAYWDACLADEWPRLEELFATDTETRARRLYRKGAGAALEGLFPDTTVDPVTQTCIIRSEHDRELVLDQRHRLYLVPSYFTWQHPFVSTALPSPIITYPVFDLQREGRAPVPPERLLKILRAAADGTRLQILQLLVQRERSTSELAGLISISEAAVSKHLKQMQEAGLVTPERQSYYVFYRLTKEALSELVQGLQSLLTQ